MKEYKVIGLERRGHLLFAVVLTQKDDKQEVFLETGNKVQIAKNKIIWPFFASIVVDDPKGMKLALEDLRNRFSQENIDLTMLWECLEQDGEYSMQQLLDVYFGEYTNDDAGALFLVLSDDRHYFQLRSGKFSKIAPETVAATLHREKAAKERSACEQQLVNWLKGKQKSVSLDNTLMQKMVAALKQYALHGPDCALPEAKRLVQILGTEADELLLLLEEKELLPKDINETVYRYQLADSYPKGVITESQNLNAPLELQDREHLQDLWNVAIDDAETVEVDDAISYHKHQNQHVVGIHIADVAHTIAADTLLDRFAQEQFASLYFPEGLMSLFPPSLVQKKLTLSTTDTRPAISGFFNFDDDGNYLHCKFLRSALTLKKRQTYESTTTAVTSDFCMQKLQELANSLRKKRVQNGAIITHIPDLKIKVCDEEISVQLKPADTPGHLIVSEFMILFNVGVARLFSEQQIPAVFRCQGQKPQPVAFDSTSPLSPLKLRWSMPGSALALTPKPHYTLGVDAYTQATSPIRRYSDLIMHRQLLAYLQKQTLPYTHEHLQKIKPLLERNEKAVKMAENSRYLFWLYKYLKKNKGKTYQGYVSRVMENQRVMVFIPELQQEFPFKVEHKVDASEEQPILLRIQGASPRKKRAHWAQVIKS